MQYKIGTLGSHSALNILSGAQAEGFKSVLITTSERREFYESFHCADEIIEVQMFQDILEHEFPDVIFIPHGSFVAYLDLKKLASRNWKIFGSKGILEWEFDREKKYKLLSACDFSLPREFESFEEVDCPVIVKYDGAGGGQGYFIAKNKEEIVKKHSDKSRKATIQEFIQGTKVYVHYFYSPLQDQLEITGADIRYETDVDSKIHFSGKSELGFQVIGNIPMVLRESTLFEYFKMGKRFVKETERLIGHRITGPFCLETIITKSADIICFEFSGRIVAGTNLWIPSSPYSYITHRENMWVGRRIAREIKNALELNQLSKILMKPD